MSVDYQKRYEEFVLPREKVFRDPVHDYIHVRDTIILDLINTREMQRLRRIKQLGTTSYTFHGAEHSRFTHSLGVYEITRRIINNFARNYPCSPTNPDYWNESERIVVLCAALLHDIGHGPYSHTFERIFNTDHEAMTRQIIMSPETEVNQVLTRFAGDLPEKVASVIDHTYSNQQVVQIISSQIDADRMDYLLRDAYYAGVSYGQYDITRVLRVIRPAKDAIYFDFSGMHAVEDYIISRYQMYMQVYFHPVSRSMEVLLNNLLTRAKYCYRHQWDSMRTNADCLMPFLTNNWTLEDYLNLDDQVLGSYVLQWQYESDPILRDLAYRMVNRHPFKSILVTQSTMEELQIAVQQVLAQHQFDTDYYLGISSSFDTPYDDYMPYHQSEPTTPIELITRTKQIVELSQVSQLVDSLTGQAQGDRRIYFPKEILTYIQHQAPDQLNPDEQKILQAYLEEINDVTTHIQERLF